jgi:hypothetical protein
MTTWANHALHPAIALRLQPTRLTGRVTELGSLGVMSHTLLKFALVACTAGFITSCRSARPLAVTFDAAQTTTISYKDKVGILRYESHPMIRASINGVSGHFMIDTGATIPILGIEASRRCKFKAFWPSASDYTHSFWDEKIRMMKATNLVIELAPGVTVRWPEVLVTGETNFFGIIDYATLKAANAVIDTRNKTITFSK